MCFLMLHCLESVTPTKRLGMFWYREYRGGYTAVTGHLLVQQGNINVRDEFLIFMVHYAGINHTTSNAKGQNNILGHAIHSVTLKLLKKKKKGKQKPTKTKTRKL